MKPIEFMHEFGYIVGGVIGVAAGATTILNYFNVDPSMLADATQTALFIASPILTFAFGVLTGWAFTNQWRKSHSYTPRKVAQMIDGLPPSLYDALSAINEAGGAATISANLECDELVRRRLLCATSWNRRSATRYYSLPPVVVRYFRDTRG